MNKYPCIIHSHASTWHDGGVAFLLKNGTIVALSSERVGDRYKHSWNSRLAYDAIRKFFVENPLFSTDTKFNCFVDPKNGLEEVDHSLFHAASTFFSSPFEESAILILDGQGPIDEKRNSAGAIYYGKNNELELIERFHPVEGIFVPSSLGHFYTSVGLLSGMKGLHQEGKTMGLAAYGTDSEFVDFFSEFIYSNSDNSFEIDPRLIYAIFGNTLGQEYFNWGLQPRNVQKIWEKIMDIRGRPLRKKNEDITQEDMNIAYAGQLILEKIIYNLTKRVKKMTGCNNLCLGGGVALNSVANGKIMDSGLFDNVYIFSAAGDDGQAIGKLLLHIHTLGLELNTFTDTTYFGLEYNQHRIKSAIRKYNKKIRIIETGLEKVIDSVVDRLIYGEVIGWFNGRSELGPRALGNRSILADPRNPNMRDIINSKVKYREWYRPLAPVILEERANEFFDLKALSPFMLVVCRIKEDKIKLIPSITHVDGTARVQTIRKSQNLPCYRLLERFCNKTGIPILLNTSFNRRGEPLVETPEDAIETFINMNLDALVLSDTLLVKQ